MKTIKRIISIFITIVLLISLAACRYRDKENTNIDNTNTDNESKDNDFARQIGYPKTVTDGQGYEMTVPQKPASIISLSLGLDETLLFLMKKDNIRGLSYLSGDEDISNIVKESEDIEKFEVDAEAIIAAQPDLVFATDENDDEFISKLRQAEILVYVVSTPSNIEEVESMITDLAAILGEKQKGSELLLWMERMLTRVSKRVLSLENSERKTVLYLDSTFHTSGKNTMFDSICEYAGTVNLASKYGLQLQKELPREKAVGYNPDIILFSKRSYEGSNVEENISEFKNDPYFKDINAVKNDMVLMLPYSHMSTYSHFIVISVQHLAYSAYPELFE